VPTLSTALCSNTTRLSNVSVCVQKLCDWPGQVNTSRIESVLCAGFPRESRSDGLIILAAVLSGVTFPVVGLKLYTRWTTGHRLWADDYTSLAATVGISHISIFGTDMNAQISLAALAGKDIAGMFIPELHDSWLNITGASLGLGKHYWNINPEHYTPLYKVCLDIRT
jgi:hypothetical protein